MDIRTIRSQLDELHPTWLASEQDAVVSATRSLRCLASDDFGFRSFEADCLNVAAYYDATKSSVNLDTHGRYGHVYVAVEQHLILNFAA